MVTRPEPASARLTISPPEASVGSGPDQPATPTPISDLVLALCAGVESVLERRQHRSIVVFRSLFAVGGQELGCLPVSENEKMSPWGQAVFDTLSAVTTEVVDEVPDRGMWEVLPLRDTRGESLHDAFVIVDEALPN